MSDWTCPHCGRVFDDIDVCPSDDCPGLTKEKTMNDKFQQAYDTLQKAGVPVYVHADDNGNFSIDAEAPECQDWAYYYVDYAALPEWEFGVNPTLGKMLDAHGLFAEWVNPGRLAVHEG